MIRQYISRIAEKCGEKGSKIVQPSTIDDSLPGQDKGEVEFGSEGHHGLVDLPREVDQLRISVVVTSSGNDFPERVQDRNVEEVLNL